MTKIVKEIDFSGVVSDKTVSQVKKFIRKDKFQLFMTINIILYGIVMLLLVLRLFSIV